MAATVAVYSSTYFVSTVMEAKKQQNTIAAAFFWHKHSYFLVVNHFQFTATNIRNCIFSFDCAQSMPM